MHLTARHARKLFSDESGQVIVITAVAMLAILSFAGLGIDVGALRAAHRQLRAAADAAAIAGALEIDYCGTTANCNAMQTAAQHALTENNLSGSTLVTQCGSTSATGVILTLNNGPCALGSSTADPHYGNAKFVEAVVSRNVPTYFIRVLGISTVRISARSEAAMGNSPFCLYVNAITGGTGTLTTSNGGHLDLNCGLMVDSSVTLVQGVHISSTVFDVSGTATGSSNQVSPSPNQNSPALPDPFSGLSAPTNPQGCNAFTSTTTQSINAGCYTSISVTKGTLTLNPGVYYMEGSFSTGNGTSVTGTGVTVYFSAGTFNLDSGSTVTLAAPTDSSNPYYGILMYQAATDTSQFTLDSGSKSSWQGALYLPGAEIDIASGGNLAAYSIVDAESVNIDPGAKFTIGDDFSSLQAGSPAKGVTAVLTE